MNPQTIPISEYLDRKGIEYREQENELIARCIFHDCDDDSKGIEAHWYINKHTSQYDCKKCGQQGNIFTLREHFDDPMSEVLLDGAKALNDHPIKNELLNTAQNIWNSSTQVPKEFAYTIKKRISTHGSRFKDGNLVLPMYNGNGTLISLQFIQADGKKKFLPGGKTVGSYYIIGEVKDVICIAEGFATAASILEATGHAVAIAFSAGNLKATAQAIKNKYTNVKLIVCADIDDYGLTKAKEAAQVVSAFLAIPVFKPEERIDEKPPTDFNDLAILQSAEKVKKTIESAEKVKNKYQFTALADLLEEPEEKIEWIVEDLLPHGGFSIIVAKPKVGKSTLVRQLAFCVASGSTFLGRTTSKGRVLYLSLEEKRSEVRNHFRMLGATREEDIGICFDQTPENALEWLREEIDRSAPVLVIIDTLFRFARVSDVNDYAKTLAALDPLLSLARSHSVHVMGVHHARKGDGFGADTTLGSTAIFGSVDTAIVLKRTDSKRTVETQQRYGVDMEPTVLTFDPDTKRTELGEIKQQDDVQGIKDEIIAFLQSESESSTEKTITENTEGRTKLKRKALRDLVVEGLVARTDSGKKGDPYHYSCSLVPAIYTEQGNKQSNDGVERKTDDQILEELGL